MTWTFSNLSLVLIHRMHSTIFVVVVVVVDGI